MSVSASEILALLPPLDARARRHAAQRIAERLSAGLSLVEAADEAVTGRADLLARFEAARRAYRENPGEAALGALYLAAHGHPPKGGDRGAMRAGTLDAEALGERVARSVVRLEADVLVAFEAAQALSVRDGVLPDDVAALAVRLADEPGWRLARAGLLALCAHAAHGREPPRQAVERACRLAAEPGAPVWTQTAALRLAGAALGPRAVPLLRSRLRPSPEHPDDFFVRAEAARVLAATAPHVARDVLAEVRGDPSEHVRIELAALLAEVGAGPALLSLADPASEPSERVRAAAVAALAPRDPRALLPVLERDPSPLTRRVALEEAEIQAHLPELRAAVRRLVQASPWPELARLAAEASERVHHRVDPDAAALLGLVEATASHIAEGGHAIVRAHVPKLELGRALAVVATADHGLEARPVRGGFLLYRGDRFGRRLWRLLHEMRHPSPDKRQGHRHTIGRTIRGPLRAPPGRLAEVTPTKVPGERVVDPMLGDWARHLPSVDDLLARPPGGTLELFSAFGVTTVKFPELRRWFRTRARLSTGYADLARVRQQSVATPGAPEYARALKGLGFAIEFRPYPVPDAEMLTFQNPPATPRGGLPAARVASMVPFLDFLDTGPLLDGTVNHLAAVGVAGLGLFLARLHEARRDVERARAAIPLSIGGWGTRGKSGTERLKAGLFQGLGHEVLVKTTGCEAMFIHCVPDVPAREVFIYRTYDKATIWEQRDLLVLAERFGVDVFLWECMALRPELVEILARHWMRDELGTLTNAYPDHENVQGPSGMDIPRVMTRFAPRAGTLLTAEEQMLPVLRDAARADGTALVDIPWRQAALLPEDVLARFPYQEHPRNVALVLAMAQLFGVERDIALKEMADHVVPDLGVLKTYPEAAWRGRRLSFSNGMSANERAGFMSNWTRLGFDRRSPDDLGEWVVTVINNRADRVSRSMVFADIVVEDAAAHAHVLIGTNLGGLRGYIEQSLARSLGDLRLGAAGEGPAQTLARADRALARVMIGAVGPERLAAEAAAMAHGLGIELSIPPALFAQALAAGADSVAASRAPVAEVLTPALAPLLAALGPAADDALGHLVEQTARHAAVLRFRAHLDRAMRGGGGLAGCEEHLRSIVGEIFRANVIVLEDPALTGDQVVDAIAASGPPGFRLHVLGAQNIKGTGLDFVYRWVSFDATAKQVAALARAEGDAAVAVAQELASGDDVGILDLVAAEEAALQAAARAQNGTAAALADVARQLGQRLQERAAALSRTRRAQPRWLAAIESVLDVYDGVRRRTRAAGVLRELTRGRLSHTRAAVAMRELILRQKGGWLG